MAASIEVTPGEPRSSETTANSEDIRWRLDTAAGELWHPEWEGLVDGEWTVTQRQPNPALANVAVFRDGDTLGLRARTAQGDYIFNAGTMTAIVTPTTDGTYGVLFATMQIPSHDDPFAPSRYLLTEYTDLTLDDPISLDPFYAHKWPLGQKPARQGYFMGWNGDTTALELAVRITQYLTEATQPQL